MKIERYTPEKQSAWNAHVESARNSHFMHKRNYMDYHADRFADHSLIFTEENGEYLAILPMSEQEKTLHSHQGLTFGGLILGHSVRSGAILEMFALLNTYASERGFSRIVYKAMPYIYHQAPTGEDEYALFRQGARLFRVDISTTVDFAYPLPFSSLRSRGAKKALKAGIAVRRSEDFSAFHGILSRILQDKYEARVTHSEQELVMLASRFPDNIKLFGAYAGEEMVAGVIIFETATVAHAQYIGASDAGREAGALDLIFSTLIQETFKHKRYFDFGISTEDAGKTLNENLIAQKEGFGGRGMTHKFYEINPA